METPLKYFASFPFPWSSCSLTNVRTHISVPACRSLHLCSGCKFCSAYAVQSILWLFYTHLLCLTLRKTTKDDEALVSYLPERSDFFFFLLWKLLYTQSLHGVVSGLPFRGNMLLFIIPCALSGFASDVINILLC